jgi:hypothetical protein
MRHRKLFFYALLCAAVLLSPQTLRAALIAYEPFLFDPNSADAGAGEYTPDTDVRTQGPTVQGFSGAWSGSTSAFEVSQFAISTNLPSAGGRLWFPGGSSEFNRNIERDLADYSGSASSTYYFSIVSRRNSWDSEATYQGLGATLPPEVFLGLSNDAKDEGVFLGYAYRTDATNTTFPSLVVRAGGVDHLASGNDSTFNDAFTTIMKLEIDFSGTQDRLSWYSAIGPGNTIPTANFSSEANAIATADFQGVITAEIVSSQTAITELNDTSPTFSGSTYFDEVRFATTWVEAAGVPEPTSALMLGLGSLGLAFIRRRR